MTTPNPAEKTETCPAQGLLKLLSGKWKPEIFRLALDGPVRFSGLLKQIEGSNKQTLAVALKELEEAELLSRMVIRLKPLHVEYRLTEKGLALVGVFRVLEGV